MMINVHYLKVRAVFIGLVVSTVPPFVIALFLVGSLVEQGGPTHVLSSLNAIFSSTTNFLTLLAATGIFYCLGGYVSARIAGEHEIAHALIAGILSVVISLATGGTTETIGESNWLVYGSWVLVASAIVSGGYLGKKMNNIARHTAYF